MPSPRDPGHVNTFHRSTSCPTPLHHSTTTPHHHTTPPQDLVGENHRVGCRLLAILATSIPSTAPLHVPHLYTTPHHQPPQDLDGENHRVGCRLLAILATSIPSKWGVFAKSMEVWGVVVVSCRAVLHMEDKIHYLRHSLHFLQKELNKNT